MPEALEVSMVASVAGTLSGGRLTRTRPFRSPHHSASMAALTGGGLKVKPGEVSLAHLGVLFLDELPEFQRAVLDSLRQPLEAGVVSVARANAHVTFPARVQLIAAMNPCRCGHLGDPALACARAPRCAADYQAKVSGPLLDRIDLHVEVQPVTAADLMLPPPAEGSAEVAARVAAARAIQTGRYSDIAARTNAEAEGDGAQRFRDSRRARAETARPSRRSDAALGAGLYPRAARGPDDRRSCGQRRASGASMSPKR
jgi:magnesium chelatase family protein